MDKILNYQISLFGNFIDIKEGLSLIGNGIPNTIIKKLNEESGIRVQGASILTSGRHKNYNVFKNINFHSNDKMQNALLDFICQKLEIAA